MAYKIFDEVGLFKSFDIPIAPFIRYFTTLERGYIDLPCKISNLDKLLQKVLITNFI